MSNTNPMTHPLPAAMAAECCLIVRRDVLAIECASYMQGRTHPEHNSQKFDELQQKIEAARAEILTTLAAQSAECERLRERVAELERTNVDLGKHATEVVYQNELLKQGIVESADG